MAIHTLSEYAVSILCHITQGENWLYIDIDAKTHQSRMCYPNPIYTTEDLTNTHACMHTQSTHVRDIHLLAVQIARLIMTKSSVHRFMFVMDILLLSNALLLLYITS